MELKHKEAFSLMWYACNCGHREQIWNSRDGVTPFGINCPSCGGIANHTDWHLDSYEPNRSLNKGQRFFRDGTPDEAESIMRKRIESMKDAYPRADEEYEQMVSDARSGTMESGFMKGWPRIETSL